MKKIIVSLAVLLAIGATSLFAEAEYSEFAAAVKELNVTKNANSTLPVAAGLPTKIDSNITLRKSAEIEDIKKNTESISFMEKVKSGLRAITESDFVKSFADAACKSGVAGMCK